MEEKELEQLLQSVYAAEGVPEEVNIRLKNQLARQQAVEESRVSLWWLPATAGTVVSFAFGLILFLAYVIINIKGDSCWMPNLLQLVSGLWLKFHLAFLAVEIVISWVVTFVGVWKGNLIKGAQIF